MSNDQPNIKIPASNSSEITSDTSKSSNVLLFFVVIIIISIFVIGGAYLFISKQSKQTAQSLPQATLQPVVRATPAAEETVDALERDLQTVQDQDADSGFASLDKDLQNL